MIRNSGISFGIDAPLVLIIVVFVGLGWWYIKERDWRLLLIIIGGGLNLGERLVRGYVIDYWRIPGTDIYNNFNDWLIFVGVVFYLWKKLR